MIKPSAWPTSVLCVAQDRLIATLAGVGDLGAEECFASGRILHLQRALTRSEERRLPDGFMGQPAVDERGETMVTYWRLAPPEV